MVTKLRAVLIICVFLLATLARADDVANGEALRIEIENLRETGRLSIGGVDIATGNTLAAFYERRSFSPTWTNPNQVGELLELVLASRDDGLEPDDYHAEQIEYAYRAMNRGVTPTPRQVAALAKCDFTYVDAATSLKGVTSLDILRPIRRSAMRRSYSSCKLSQN